MKTKEFNYTYTAPTEEERKEIASIRRQYQAPQELDRPENKIERLKALNAHVENTATVFGLVFGVVGILVFGLGLTMILEWSLWLYGVLVSIVGAIPTALAYPVYRLVLRRNKRKYGDEIVRLCEEVLREN